MAAWISQARGDPRGTLASPSNVRRYVPLSILLVLILPLYYSAFCSHLTSFCCYVALNQRRFMISQDYAEIFITIAEYDKEYEDYICGRPARANTQRTRPIVHDQSRMTASSSHDNLKMSPPTPTPTAARNKGKEVDSRGVHLGSDGQRGSSRQPPSDTGLSCPGNQRTPHRPAYADPPPFNLPAARPGEGFFQTGRNNAQTGHHPPPDPPRNAPSGRPYLYPNRGFLTMMTYGPVSITIGKEIEQLCKVIAALSMQVLSEPKPASGF